MYQILLSIVERLNDEVKHIGGSTVTRKNPEILDNGQDLEMNSTRKQEQYCRAYSRGVMRKTEENWR